VEVVAARTLSALYITLDIAWLGIFGAIPLWRKKRTAFVAGLIGGLVYFIVDYGIFYRLLGTRVVRGADPLQFLLWLSLSYGFTNIAWIWLLLDRDGHAVEWLLMIILGWVTVALLSRSFGAGFAVIAIRRGTSAYRGMMALLLAVGYGFLILRNLLPDPRSRVAAQVGALDSLWRSIRMNGKLVNRSTGFLALLFILGVIAAGCASVPAAVEPAGAPTPAVAPTLAPTSAAEAAPTTAPTTAPTPVPAAAAGAYWPTEGWRTSTPEEQGMDSKMLAEMVAEINARKMKVHSLLVIRNGYLVSENYFNGFTPDGKHEMQSVVKSFISTLVGMALDKGYLDGTNRRVVDLFSDRPIKLLDERKEKMTVEDLLTMRSGLDYTEVNNFSAADTSPDLIQYMLDLPMARDPGSKWVYCTGCSYLLAAIVGKTSGMSIFDFADQNLLKPLGITDYRWSGDAARDNPGIFGLHLRPRDMAKLGYLYLRKGQWDGRQIVSSDWVEQATQQRTDVDVDPHFGYGYHWFTVPAMKGYAALGTGGQIILVVPESDLIIVSTANTEESIFELFEKYVLPVVQNSQ
jgi:CubicO group peptidase (beta-lactamase class C family)